VTGPVTGYGTARFWGAKLCDVGRRLQPAPRTPIIWGVRIPKTSQAAALLNVRPTTPRAWGDRAERLGARARPLRVAATAIRREAA
jgi:hypothetical protein